MTIPPIRDPILGRGWVNYRVTKLIGSGGMGSVYEMQHERLPRRKAIKVLHPTVLVDGQRRFQQEALAASAVDSEKIVKVDDVVEKALSKAPADRFQTAAEMREALLRVVPQAVLAKAQLRQRIQHIVDKDAPPQAPKVSAPTPILNGVVVSATATDETANVDSSSGKILLAFASQKPGADRGDASPREATPRLDEAVPHFVDDARSPNAPVEHEETVPLKQPPPRTKARRQRGVLIAAGGAATFVSLAVAIWAALRPTSAAPVHDAPPSAAAPVAAVSDLVWLSSPPEIRRSLHSEPRRRQRQRRR